MFPIHRAPRQAFPVALSALLMFGLWTACATALTPSPAEAAGVAKVTVTFDGTNVKVDPDPVVACFLGSCKPKVNQIHWDAPKGESLGVQVNSSPEGKPCRTYSELRYKRDPGFRTIQCKGSHCETVGPPRETGCFKYDVTVTPSGGKPVRLDPDMIIM